MIPPNNCDCEECQDEKVRKVERDLVSLETAGVIPKLQAPIPAYLKDPDEWFLPPAEGIRFVRRWWQDDQLFEELIPAEKIFIGVDVAKPLSEYTHESVSVPFMIDPAVVDEAVGAEYEALESFWDRFNDLYQPAWEEVKKGNEMVADQTLQNGIVSPNPKAPFANDEAIPDWAALFDPDNLESRLHEVRSLNAEAILAGQLTAEIKDGVIEIRTYARSHALDVLEAAAKAKPENYRRAHNPATCPECQDDLIQGTLTDQIAYYREVTRLRTEGAYRLIYSAKPYGQALFQTCLDAAGDIALLLALLERR